jgi:hypothetical protein
MCSASAGQGQLNHNAVHDADDDETGKTKEKRGVAGSASPNFFFLQRSLDVDQLSTVLMICQAAPAAQHQVCIGIASTVGAREPLHICRNNLPACLPSLMHMSTPSGRCILYGC